MSRLRLLVADVVNENRSGERRGKWFAPSDRGRGGTGKAYRSKSCRLSWSVDVVRVVVLSIRLEEDGDDVVDEQLLFELLLLVLLSEEDMVDRGVDSCLVLKLCRERDLCLAVTWVHWTDTMQMVAQMDSSYQKSSFQRISIVQYEGLSGFVCISAIAIAASTSRFALTSCSMYCYHL